MVNPQDLVDQVLAIDSSKSRSDILRDLEYTKSAEQTVNRIFDGEFLRGIKTTPAARSPTSFNTSIHNTEDALIILDSDEEVVSEGQHLDSSELDLPKLPQEDSQLSSPALPASKIFNNFDDDADDDDDNEEDGTLSKKKYKHSQHSDDLRAAADYITELYAMEDSFLDEDNVPPKITKKLPEPVERSITLDSLEDTTPATLATKPKKDLFEGIFRLQDSLSDKEDGDRNKRNDDDMESIHSTSSFNRKSPPFSPMLPLSIVSPVSPLFRSHSNDNDLFSIDVDTPPSIHSNGRVHRNDSDSDDALPSVDEFFSQMMAPKPKKAAPKRKVIEIDEDDGNDDDVDDVPVADRKGKRRAYDYNSSPPRSNSLFDEDDDDDSISNRSSSLTAKERKKLEAAERKRIQAEERKKSAEEKQRLKEEKELERQRLKEQKQMEKHRAQLLEKENRLKIDRTNILKEMIIEFHPDFVKTKAGELIQLTLEKKEAATKIMANALLPFHVTWQRICSAEWDPITLTFIPFSPSKIIKEPYVLVFEDVFDFVVRIQQDKVDSFIDDVERQTDPGIQIMLLIEGLETYYRKKLTATRRAIDSMVRSNMECEGSTSTTARPRKVNAQAEIIKYGPDRDQVEEVMNYLQLMRDVMLVPTKTDEDTASWIESLTTDLALGRYKSKNVNNAAKASKSGTDPKDCWHKLLQEIHLCTPPVANSIVDEYPTLQSLHKAYERKPPADGERLLSGLEVERSSVRVRDRRVNNVMSKKIYTIFNETDPNQTIY